LPGSISIGAAPALAHGFACCSVTSVAFSPDGSTLAAADANDHTYLRKTNSRTS
jgi:hypothetical protein